MSTQYAHIGEAIKARRLALGLTQGDLCERMGWGAERKGDLSEIESGRHTNLSLNRVFTIAKALHCHAGDLVFMVNTELEASA